MKIPIAALTLSSLMLAGGFATAGTWVDSYWPLNDGDTKTFLYNGVDQLTMDVSYYGGGEYQISYDSPDGSGSEFHQNTGTGIYLDHAKVGWINVYMNPAVLLMNNTMLQNGGSATTSTTVSQQSVDYPATYTITISKAGSVKVPVGTFADCRNISVTEKATVPGQGTVTVNALTAVLAPDVGIIKKLVSQGVWAQLVSGTVDGTDVAILATGAPLLTIKTPVKGQRIATNSNTVSIKGSVSGYPAGMQVFYQINSGTWTGAMVVGTNWSGSVLAQPGTNILNAYALDSVGRSSPTVSVGFQFVVNAVLQVATVGKGTLSPNYSNAVLEIGRVYKVTATPAKGHAFTNWTGRVNGDEVLTTNKAALSFVMQSNLVLTATFVDVQKPVLAITSPTLNQRWSNAVFTVAGKVADNGALAGVSYQLNGGDWTVAQTANGWSNWTASVTLVPGTNSVRAYALDAAGNRSLTNSVNFTYVLSGVLQVATIGKGTLSPNYSNAVLEIGRVYKVTATPAKGHAFTNWTGRVNGDEVLTTNKAALSFVMQSNLVLTATFVDVQKPVLAITSPTLNQRWSNAVFTVAGKVADNGALAGVSYQLNGGDWTVAQTANGWSNWTANVTLVPGTNTVRAYAVDAAGNWSLTNSQKVVYVVTYWLPDYYYPVSEGNQWIYDAQGNWDGSPNAMWRVDSVSIPLTCYTGRNPVRTYTRNVVQLYATYGSYSGMSFTPTDEWIEYPIAQGGWGSAGFDDDPGTMEMRLDPALLITNRMTIGQTITLTADAYVNAAYVSKMTYKLQLVERGSVAVPAGTYPDCLHLKYTVSLPSETQNIEEWWALGVGMVKKMVTKPGEPANQFELRAASFVAPAPAIPAKLAAATVSVTPDLPLQFDCGNGGMLVTNGLLQMRLSGPPGAVVVVEACTNLADPTWFPMATNILTSGQMYFTDPQWTNYPGRFYRLRSQ